VPTGGTLVDGAHAGNGLVTISWLGTAAAPVPVAAQPAFTG
jgi:hypothetical protein